MRATRRILITGAAGGIGAATAHRLAAQDTILTLTDLQSEALDQLAREITACGGNVHTVSGDLSLDDFCDGLPAQAHDLMGGLDGLVNNAGVMRRGAITDSSDDDFRLSMRINVEAPFRLCRATIPLMESFGGSIVNTASCWGIHPGPSHVVYCMTKAALASMTQCLGRDHAHQKIRVNAVCPNEVNTPMLRTGFEIRGLDPDQAIETLNASVPLGHIADPTEIADVIVFLLSPQSAYMCGSLVEINGGKPVY